MIESRRTVGWNIRRLRVAAGLSMEQLAWKAQIAPNTLAQIERVEMNPSLITLDKIAHALGVRPIELFVEIASRPKPLRPGPRGPRQKRKKRRK